MLMRTQTCIYSSICICTVYLFLSLLTNCNIQRNIEQTQHEQHICEDSRMRVFNNSHLHKRISRDMLFSADALLCIMVGYNKDIPSGRT